MLFPASILGSEGIIQYIYAPLKRTNLRDIVRFSVRSFKFTNKNNDEKTSDEKNVIV